MRGHWPEMRSEVLMTDRKVVEREPSALSLCFLKERKHLWGISGPADVLQSRADGDHPR